MSLGRSKARLAMVKRTRANQQTWQVDLYWNRFIALEMEMRPKYRPILLHMLGHAPGGSEQ